MDSGALMLVLSLFGAVNSGLMVAFVRVGLFEPLPPPPSPLWGVDG